jgi:hypothetical protein
MYSFAKFRADHIFLQNRDRKNIKKFGFVGCGGWADLMTTKPP